MNIIEIPEIDVTVLAGKLESDELFVLLDVRETEELEQAKISDSRIVGVPMSRMSRLGIDAFPKEVQKKDTEILTICHHGVRSLQVAEWMRAQGWTNVVSVRGGIDDYANRVDASVGKY